MFKKQTSLFFCKKGISGHGTCLSCLEKMKSLSLQTKFFLRIRQIFLWKGKSPSDKISMYFLHLSYKIHSRTIKAPIQRSPPAGHIRIFWDIVGVPPRENGLRIFVAAFLELQERASESSMSRLDCCVTEVRFSYVFCQGLELVNIFKSCCHILMASSCKARPWLIQSNSLKQELRDGFRSWNRCVWVCYGSLARWCSWIRCSRRSSANGTNFDFDNHRRHSSIQKMQNSA